MARLSKMTACALNIIIQDKSKRNYEKLFQKVKALNKTINMPRNTAASILTFYSDNTNYGKYWFGSFCRYTNINPPYYDSILQELLLDEDGKPKEILDPKIKANASFVDFCLFPEEHKLFVITNEMSPNSIYVFFSRLFKSVEIVEEFGDVDVVLHTTEEGIEKILALPNLKKLDIFLHKPNPTGLNRYDMNVDNLLSDQDAEQMSLSISTQKEDLNPNQFTKDLAHAAKNHGHVNARSKDSNGRTIATSTRSFPLIEYEVYEKGKEAGTNVFIRLCKKALKKITQ